MLKRVIAAGAAFVFLSANGWAQTASTAYIPGGGAQQQCGISSHIVSQFQAYLDQVITQNNGGLFQPNNMWAAIVDRKGVLCAVFNTIGQPDTPPQDPWPGSRSIAIAKASTANDFSNNKLALSTANLYGLSLPGGSLWGLNETNPFNPQFQPQGTGIGYVPGGIVTFGGGVALYMSGQVIGGLGVSGDTSCADHAIAYRMRKLSGLDKIPANSALPSDNIQYAPAGSTALTIANTFQQPHCLGQGIDVIPN
jgi:uncharacterized protein GlcG (DUF336 family)